MAEQDTQDQTEPVDIEHERNLKVSAMMEAGTLDKDAAKADYRTTHDGGTEGEELPSHREGEVWESMDPDDDEIGGGRRRVRVQSVGDEVVAVNPVSGVVSHFRAENLAPPKWRRAHS